MISGKTAAQTGCGDGINSLGRLKLSRDCACRVTQAQKQTKENRRNQDNRGCYASTPLIQCFEFCGVIQGLEFTNWNIQGCNIFVNFMYEYNMYIFNQDELSAAWSTSVGL